MDDNIEIKHLKKSIKKAKTVAKNANFVEEKEKPDK